MDCWPAIVAFIDRSASLNGSRECYHPAMIARIEGVLESIEDGAAMLRVGEGFVYEVLISAYTASRLGASIGRRVTFHTLHYLEGQNQGSSFLPRLAGFLTADDQRFFELFTTTKGIGNRRAMRAMTLPIDRIAAAIADRDVAVLRSLPEIGPRTAETIIATLHGKVDPFISAAAYADKADPDNASAASSATSAPARALAREALEVLLQLGENRTQALTWIDQVLRDAGDDRPVDVQEIVARVYRLKNR